MSKVNFFVIQVLRMKNETADSGQNQVKLYDTDTWTLYTEGLCSSCRARCCSLSVEVTLDDLIRMEIVSPLEATGSLQKVGRRLKKRGIVSEMSPAQSCFTLAQDEKGACIFLDPQSCSCSIYAKRPTVCREFPQVGPRFGHCPYQAR